VVAIAGFDRQGIARFVRDWDRAFERGEYTDLAAVYDDYATLVFNDALPFIGRHAIAEFWREACVAASARGLRRATHVDQYDYCGDAAYVQGTVTLTSDAQGTTTVVWFVMVWKRQHRAGPWQIVADISSVAARALDRRQSAGRHATAQP